MMEGKGEFIMSKKEDEQSSNPNEMEKWMEKFFLDPFTSYLDQIMFRVDLYETENELIVEALLQDYQHSNIIIYLKGNQLIITALKNEQSLPSIQSSRTRKVDFPFLVIQKEVNAQFSNGILEIFISKTKKGYGKNRMITLP